ncbi:MAG: hypothetical protein U5K76_02180 [Woeseiaceae bacterium]|nr:hypothetical protein [Woeseiaceae bacterium]
MTQSGWQQQLIETSDTGYLVLDGSRVVYANTRARVLLAGMLHDEQVVPESPLAGLVASGGSQLSRAEVPSGRRSAAIHGALAGRRLAGL